MEDENIQQAIPNSQSWNWMKKNIPLFECPQQNFEEDILLPLVDITKAYKEKQPKDMYLQNFWSSALTLINTT